MGNMATNYSNKIRALAEHGYVLPARREGRQKFEIRVRDVLNTMVEREGLPRQNVPQVCSALRSPRKFLQPLGLEIEKIEGPPSQTSPTVVFHYRFLNEAGGNRLDAGSGPHQDERVHRQGSPLARLRGLLREEMAAYGGGEAFLKWLRTDPEKDRR
jgi:hypothetical protein